MALVALTVATVPRIEAGELLRPERWQEPQRTDEVLETLQTIPDGAVVAASNDLGPRLVTRTELYFFGDPAAELGGVADLPDCDEIDWIAYDTGYDSVVPRGRATLDRLLASGEYDVVVEGGGVLVARRATSGE